MITVIIILFRLCGMSLVHHKAIIRDNHMCSYWSLWIYGVTSNHSIPKKRKGMTCNHILVATPANCYKGVVSTVPLYEVHHSLEMGSVETTP